ncbi:radical SAM/SPASM domain-containing protein [Candidatus Atribacteria bacterium HGW-Atribacteria-1]|nr:MAG: radical SAM/SPASM domain-containing protein [Candidatus Atribacteria bacterium HGW-Atribacteria-1]
MIKSRFIHEYSLNKGTFLFHTLTFDYHILNQISSELWREQKYSQLLADEKLKLIEKKFLLNNKKKDDILFQKAIRFFSKRKDLSPSFLIYITNECNLNCSYCFQKGERKYSYTSLTEQTIDAILSGMEKLLGKFHTTPSKRITIFGGEPLLPKNKNTVNYLCSRLQEDRENIYHLGIITNGIFIPSYIDEFKKHNNIINYIKVTLDGPEKIHNQSRIFRNGQGTYKIIINNIKLFLEQIQNIKVYINILLNERNINYILELFDDLERESIFNHDNVKIEFGRIQFRANPLIANYEHELKMSKYYSELLKLKRKDARITDDMLTGSELKFIGDLYRFWKNNEFILPNMKGCSAVYPGRYCFYPNGKIYPCTEIAGTENMAIAEYKPDFSINPNIYEWKNYNVLHLEKCNTCKYIAICNGGCPVSNLGVHSNLKKVYCLDIEEGINNFISELQNERFFKNENN